MNEDVFEHSICNMCGDELNDDNWYPSSKKYRVYRCKRCIGVVAAEWAKDNVEKRRDISIRARRKVGIVSMGENRTCSKFLGIHIAERVLKHVFKNAVQMPDGNRGYDFICGRGYMVDVKSSCTRVTKGYSPYWTFTIKRNQIADYFLCLAFDNRADINPLYMWLISGDVLNRKTGTTISETTLSKWNEYQLDIDKVVMCCDTLKGDLK